MTEQEKKPEEIVEEIEAAAAATAEELEDMAEELTDKSPLEQFFHHQRRALEETRKALDTLLPPGFKEHSRNASDEFTTGFRVLVDATIDEMKRISEKEEEPEDDEEENDDDSDDNNEESSTGKNKVKIEVD